MLSDRKIFLFSEVLDKKSKLRNYTEKSKKFACVACYEDNEISIKIKSILINQDKSSHEQWIKDLLVNYYDPMYDYQLKAKKHRCILNGNKSKVINYLNQIQTNQSL